MIRTFLKPLSFIPAILLMYMIFQFSAQSGDVSSQLSYKVSYKIVETADYVFETNLDYWQMDEWAVRINGVTRKLAHMTEYFALAVAVSFPLYVYGVHGILLMLLAGMICVGFACGDEYHQSFVAGRSPSVRDVCIDGFGVFWGIILVRIIGWTGRKTIFRPRKKKKKQKDIEEQFYEDAPLYEEPSYMQQPYYGQPVGYGPAQSCGQPVGHGPVHSYGRPVGYGPAQSYNQTDGYDPTQMNYDPQAAAEHQSSKGYNSILHGSAYDGSAEKPYDPQDPFQDWMDDYFPEDKS